jgi:hypothetical protein
MRKTHLALFASAALAVGFTATPARAAHHLWRLERAFSSSDGTLQYVELFTADGTETGVSGQTVVGSSPTPFTFSAGLAGNTTNTWLLLASPNFQAVTGLQPDGILPSGFLSRTGGNLNYASGVDTWAYGALPTNGHTMFVRDPSTNQVTSAPAVATNFAGMSVSVTAPALPAPALPRWGVVAALGLLLLAGSGLVRSRASSRLAS